MCALFVASWRKIYLFSNRRTYQHLPDFNVILCFVPGCVCVYSMACVFNFAFAELLLYWVHWLAFWCAACMIYVQNDIFTESERKQR